MNDFTVVTKQHTDRTVVAVSGEMDLHTSPGWHRPRPSSPWAGRLCTSI